MTRDSGATTQNTATLAESRTGDRPFLVASDSIDVIHPRLSGELVEAIRSGRTIASWNEPDAQDDIGSIGRRILWPEPHDDMSGPDGDRVRRATELRIDWRGEEDMLRMVGIRTPETDQETIRDLSGNPIDTNVAMRRLFDLSCDIAIRTLSTLPSTERRTRTIRDLLLAHAAASHVPPHGTSMRIVAPSPWSDATLHVVGPGTDYHVDPDPTTGGLIPIMMRIAAGDSGDAATRLFKIEALSISVKAKDMPHAIEAMRIISEHRRECA